MERLYARDSTMNKFKWSGYSNFNSSPKNIKVIRSGRVTERGAFRKQVEDEKFI